MDDDSVLVKIGIAIIAIDIILNITIPNSLNRGYRNELEKNTSIYADEIDMYNKLNQEYAAYINSLELDDLEIIVKVMHDIWGSIDGYGEADELIIGYYRLSFQDEGKGVCTSFADDFTAKMNAINPEYDAKNVLVHFADDIDGSTIVTIDIDRKILEYNTSQSLDLSGRFLRSHIDNANHMVSSVTIPSKGIKLIVDPTNLLIGLIHEGKIIIFNCNAEEIADEVIEYRRKSNATLSEMSFIKAFSTLYDETCYDLDLTIEELNKLYGYEAQSNALVEVLKISETDNPILKRDK